MGLPSTMQPAMQPGPQSAIPPNGATTSPPLSALPPGASQSSNVPPAPVNPGYPWSTRPLRPYQQQTNPPSPPITPFPRYGFSVPPYPSHSGHILLFGGLVRDRAHNDLWSLDVRDCSLQLVKTRGDAPLPRIGHVSAIADRIMLVFGGDTKINEDDQQDDGLYVLDLRTQEWTQVPVLAGPSGRYGHAACMLGGYFYVHGGHVDGRNLDDLWSFDIRQLGQGSGPYKWERVSYTNPAPLARTGHTLVPYRNQLYLFGGTDGDYHYNDSWSLDIASGVWTELECIGYIPIPREGHAAAIVDDVVYVFGGRDVHGKDLGDLAAFRISNQRWYMFQNMGPAPMAKSGHSLCAAHGKVFVIGGESNQSPQIQRDDPNLVHVLDTTKIKYPTDQNVPRRGRTTSETTDLRSGPGQSPYGQHGGPGANQQFPAGSRSVDNIGRSMSPPSIGSEPRPLVIANDTTGNQQSKHAPRSESNDSHSGGNRAANGAVVAGAAGMAGAATAAAAAAGMAPQRPKREDDDEYRRAMSPSTNTNGTDSSTPPADRIVTPIGPNGRAPTSPTSIVPSHTIHPNAQRTSRSPPPQLRLNENGDRPALPPDAFYFSGSGGKSPTSGSRPTSINGRPNSMLGRPGSTVGRPGSIVGRPGSIAGAADLVRELKAREVEADNAKRREAAMRVILSRAIQQGFVLDEEASVDPPLTDMLGENPAVRQVAEALVQLKQEKANLQNEVASQIKIANDRLLEAERLQKGALHEAAFYRAKSAALDNGSTAELKRVEADRIADLEHQLDSTVVEYEKNKTELERMQAELGRHVDLSTSASEREADTLKRAEQAEEENARLHEEIEELQERTGANDRAVRDHTERFITLSSANQQREAERDEYKNQLETALNKHNEYLTIIEQTQGSITAAGVRAAELETLHGKAKDQVSQLEQELAEARRQLEDKTREAEQASQRLAEVETLHNTTREEANSLRTVTNGHLGQLLEIHRTTRGDEERAIKGHQEQLRALEEEKSSLLKLLREAGQRVDDTEAVASSHRQKARELESSHQNLRSEMRTHRTKLLNVQNEMSKYRGLYATKDAELRDRDQAVTELQTRVVLLRKMMGDHGIVVTDAELNNAELPSTSELETKLRDKARAHENAEREIEELTRRCREAEDKAESLTRHVDRINATRSGSSASMRSGSPGTHNVTEARALEAERKVQELEEKLSVVESDYQTAVRYVKGTEKMLNRMKVSCFTSRTDNRMSSTNKKRPTLSFQLSWMACADGLDLSTLLLVYAVCLVAAPPPLKASCRAACRPCRRSSPMSKLSFKPHRMFFQLAIVKWRSSACVSMTRSARVRCSARILARLSAVSRHSWR